MKTYSSSKIKILIAEHDAGNLELIHQELKTSGINYISEVVPNEQEYTTVLKEFLPPIKTLMLKALVVHMSPVFQ